MDDARSGSAPTADVAADATDTAAADAAAAAAGVAAAPTEGAAAEADAAAAPAEAAAVGVAAAPTEGAAAEAATATTEAEAAATATAATAPATLPSTTTTATPPSTTSPSTKPTITPLAAGVQKVILRPGGGPALVDGTIVRVTYTGRLGTTGAVFDTTEWRGGAPMQVEVGSTALIPGWAIALSSMRAGESARYLIPSALAYGEDGVGPVPPNTDLEFDVEVVDVVDWPPVGGRRAAATDALKSATTYLADAQKLKDNGNDRLRTGDLLGALHKYKHALQFMNLLAAAPDAMSMPPTAVGERAALVITLHANLSQVNLRLSRWADALEECQCVLAVEPRHAKSLYRVALAHHGAGDLVAAADASRSFLAVYPDNEDGMALLAKCSATAPPPAGDDAPAAEAAAAPEAPPAPPAPVVAPPAPTPPAPAPAPATETATPVGGSGVRRRGVDPLAAAARATFAEAGGLYADKPGYDRPLPPTSPAPWYRRLASTLCGWCPCSVRVSRAAPAGSAASR